MARLLVLGSGNLFSEDNYCSSYIFENDDKEKLLFDCGPDFKYALRDLNIDDKIDLNVGNIDKIFISHCHNDHIGGIPYFGYMRHFLGLPKPKLIIPSMEIFKNLFSIIFNQMDCISNRFTYPDFYFDILGIGKYDDNILPIELKHIHVNSGLQSKSYGLLLYYNNKQDYIFITSDMNKSNLADLLPIYRDATIIIQDCEVGSESDAHISFDSLCKSIPPKIKEKMYLTHLLHYDFNFTKKVFNSGFRGILEKGDILNL